MQRLMAVVVLALVVGACSAGDGGGSTGADAGTSSTARTAVRYEPVYETVACDGERFEGRFAGLEGVEGVDMSRIECGTLTVPEDRSDPDGRDVVLPVATLRSSSPEPDPDPYVYFSGGPGDAGSKRVCACSPAAWCRPPATSSGSTSAGRGVRRRRSTARR